MRRAEIETHHRVFNLSVHLEHHLCLEGIMASRACLSGRIVTPPGRRVLDVYDDGFYYFVFLDVRNGFHAREWRRDNLSKRNLLYKVIHTEVLPRKGVGPGLDSQVRTNFSATKSKLPLWKARMDYLMSSWYKQVIFDSLLLTLPPPCWISHNLFAACRFRRCRQGLCTVMWFYTFVTALSFLSDNSPFTVFFLPLQPLCHFLC